MKPWLQDLLRCPRCVCDEPLTWSGRGEPTDCLVCGGCAAVYPIVGGIPRFISAEQNYAENFGTQWRAFRSAQIDRLAGHTLSASRFFQDTRWDSEWLRGKLILDAGCGAGRFADVMAEHGARVIGCDLSTAAEACRDTERDPRGRSPNRGEIEVVQADLLALPFGAGTFDAVHCAGVIQHTADPERTIRALVELVRPGGRLFLNFYEIDPTTRFQVVKYLLRHTTPSWPAPRLFSFCRWLCRIFFVPSLIMSRIPIVRFFNRFLPICSVHPAGIPIALQYEMTLLDTVDWYGPKYEIRQDHIRVGALLRRHGLAQVETAPGLAWAIKSETSNPAA